MLLILPSLAQGGSPRRVNLSFYHPFHCWLMFPAQVRTVVNVRKGPPMGPGPAFLTPGLIPVSLLGEVFTPGNKPLLREKPWIVEKAEKTLEWSTVSSEMSILTVLTFPSFLLSSSLTTRIPAHLSTFNQEIAEQAALGRGILPTVKRVKGRLLASRGV